MVALYMVQLQGKGLVKDSATVLADWNVFKDVDGGMCPVWVIQLEEQRTMLWFP